MPAIKNFLVGFSLLGLSLSPLSALAIDTPSQKTAINFCTRITTIETELDNKFTNVESQRIAKRTDILGKLKERKDQRAAQIQAKRDETKSKFDERISQLEVKAVTDAQKEAVADFKKAVEEAQATRKAAVDAAIKTYQDALATLVSSREDILKNAAAVFETTMQTAITTAKTNCTEGDDPAAVRQTFMASMKSAWDVLRSSVQVKVQGENMQQVEALAKTRNEAIKAANDAFRTSVKEASVILKAAFPLTEPETSE